MEIRTNGIKKVVDATLKNKKKVSDKSSLNATRYNP